MTVLEELKPLKAKTIRKMKHDIHLLELTNSHNYTKITNIYDNECDTFEDFDYKIKMEFYYQNVYLPSDYITIDTEAPDDLGNDLLDNLDDEVSFKDINPKYFDVLKQLSSVMNNSKYQNCFVVYNPKEISVKVLDKESAVKLIKNDIHIVKNYQLVEKKDINSDD